MMNQMDNIVKIPPTLRELIPLSILALDLPGRDFVAELRSRGVEITVDDLGRAAVSRSVARQLIQEHNEAQTQAAERAKAAAAELDRQSEEMRRAIPRGIEWWKLEGTHPAEAMLMAAKAAEPHSSVPSAGEWMFGGYEVGGSLESAEES